MSRFLVRASVASLSAAVCCAVLQCGAKIESQPTAHSVCDVPPNAVTAVSNLRYGADLTYNSLDLFLPTHRAGEPVVVLAHAGGWIGGDKRFYDHVGTAFARCGIALASINYPLAPRARADVQAAAVRSAARWITVHAPAYGYASDRLFLMGHSAGAELVALAVLDRTKPKNAASGPAIAGVIALDGLGYRPARDFATEKSLPDLPRYYVAAFGGDQKLWTRYDLAQGLHRHEPPFVVVHGLDDTYVPAADSRGFVDALRAAGDSVSFLQPQGQDHNSVISALARDPHDPTANAIERFIFGNGAQPATAQRQPGSGRPALVVSLPSLPPLKLPRPDHVIVVVEENHSYAEIMGSNRAPYMNQLAAKAAVFTQSFAVAHPSAPNYIALFTGQTNNNGDDCPEQGVPADAPNLGGELIANGLSFAGYSETMPSAGFTGCFAGFAKWSYARKHNPWVNFTTVPPSSNQPFSALPAPDKLPTVAFIIPNQAHDMHSGTIEDADHWLQQNVGPIIDWAATHNSLFILTWDEDDRSQNNQIPTIFVGPMVKPGNYDVHIDHYSVLRTLEAMYALPLAGKSAGATPISACWR